LQRQAGDVAARARQTRDHADANGVSDRCEYDGNRRGGPLCRDHIERGVGDDDIDRQPDELGHELGRAIGTSLGPTILDGDVAPFIPSQFTQTMDKRFGRSALSRRRVGAEKSDDR
jgi:hypothetical protein